MRRNTDRQTLGTTRTLLAGQRGHLDAAEASPETPAERAQRLTGKLAGLLKDELAEYGGGDAFIRWIRSDEDEAA